MTADDEFLAPHKPMYPLTEIAQLLALKVQPEGETMRTTVDKVRKRLIYAAKSGKLHVIGPPAFPLFIAPQVFAWARKNWPEAFGDVSVAHDVQAQSHIRIGAVVRDHLFPGDLNECHRLLREMYDEVESLQGELATAEREIARLEPLAERYEQNRAKNQASAKRPRKDV